MNRLKQIIFTFCICFLHLVWATESETLDLKKDKYWDNGTSFFFKLYGNYGGYGNKGGEPWDALDRAFEKHDYRYGEYGFLDAKSDARLIEEIPFVLFNKDIHNEGYIFGPLVFMAYATVIPSLYRFKVLGKKSLLVPLPNGGCALCINKSEQMLKFFRDQSQFKRMKKRVEDFLKKPFD